jgi:voltage-gated potassium channel
MDVINQPNSSLTPSEIIKLSLKSYLELILNFSLLYALTDASLWKDCSAPIKITDSIYYSGITITTTGYGDITPIYWYPQFLAVYEVFCGVLLLVVCFAIYAARLSLTNVINNKNVTVQTSSTKKTKVRYSRIIK